MHDTYSEPSRTMRYLMSFEFGAVGTLGLICACGALVFIVNFVLGLIGKSFVPHEPVLTVLLCAVWIGAAFELKRLSKLDWRTNGWCYLAGMCVGIAVMWHFVS